MFQFKQEPWYTDNHMILSKSQAVNGFDLSLPGAVCFWTSQLFDKDLGELITKYGFSTAFTTSHNLAG